MIVEKDETESTNDDARALAESGAPAGSAVLARRQTRGRGRAGRAWVSPDGGLYLSVVLRPRAAPLSWSLLPIALGAACARELRALGFPVDVKWPNDLLLQGEKCGGILVETRLGEHPFAVVGVGIDLHVAPVEGSTSLAAHAPPPQAGALAGRLVAAFLEVSRRLDAGEAEALRGGARDLVAGLGRHVEWEGGSGVARDIALDGALVVESGGRLIRVVAGDVRLRWGATGH